jgi:DNA repair protein SbcC/Rad50
MRPHRLRVQAFGAFAATERVSFDDLESLFLLHGETGAGKTTLLDAIAFALYGRVPGERGKTRRLRSDHAAVGVRTEVELEATIGGRRLRITRKPEQERPKKAGTGTVKEQASVLLEEATPTGGWEVKSTRVGEADAEIADLMGMSADQFFQVVLLPQGRFAQFLHADAKDRADLLQKLFGTDRFAAVEEWLAKRRNDTRHEVEAAAERVNRLVAQVAQAAGAQVPEAADTTDDVPAGAFSWQADWAGSLAASAAAVRDEAAARVAARKRDLDDALAEERQAEQLAGRQHRRREALRRQDGVAADIAAIERLRVEADAAVRAADVAQVLDAADDAEAGAAAARGAEAEARAAIPDGHAAPRDAGPEALREAGRDQQSRLGMLDGLRAIELNAAAEDETAAAARAKAAGLDRELTIVRTSTEQRQSARPAAAGARDDASRAAEAQSDARAAASTARQVAEDSAALVTERAGRDRLHETHLGARERAVTRREEASVLREARIDGMRAELAATMTDGSPCPVCGSLDHPDPVEPTFEAVSREHEEAANARADEAAAEADEIGRKVAAADARIDELTQRLAAAGFPGTPAADSLAVLVAAADQAEAEAARLAAEAAALARLQREVEELDAAIAADKARLAELTEKRAAAEADAANAAMRAEEHRTTIRAQLGAAPDVDGAVRLASLLAAAFTGAADAADDTTRTAAEARDAAERAIRAATDAGFGAGHDDHAESGAGAVAAARAAFRDARWRRDAATRISDHETEAKAVASLLADPDLAVELDPPAPVGETTAKAGEAQQAHDAANSAYGEAKHTAEQLAELQPRLDDALAILEPLRARADGIRQLADLAEGRGANQYKMTLSSFVLAARLEEVAQAASERLLTMTSGRYSLVHTDARRRSGAKSGLGLLACDAWTGVDRDTSTLSGGETFLASLALALGLADVVTAESAGTPMEALFVDEGFGTLDEDTLDEVMNVLDGLRAGGRIVGIVSHVAELRQRIPAQVHVRKGQHGSHVTVTAG